MYPYNIKIEKNIIQNITEKVKNYNWKKIDKINSWEMGTNYLVLKKICKYWITKYS